MVKMAEKIIYIQDHEGGRVPFDPLTLQTRLINCFLTAGLRENSYMAEDIALAVEYTLLNSNRPELVFGQGELAAAVIRMLEETGFPEVAALYRRTSGERHVAIDSDPVSVSGLLRKFLACSDEAFFDRISSEVSHAAKILGITEADPHLYLELARHYERKFAIEGVAGDPVARLRVRTSATKEELTAVLPPEALALTKAGILRINEINEIFSRIRFFFMMRPFAKQSQLAAPVTEMEIEPLLFQMSRTLEQARAAIENALELPDPLPVHLSIPDMSQFIIEYFGVEQEKSRRIADELADALCFEFKNGIYKLSVN